MAITALPYGTFLLDLGAGVHNFASDDDRAALLTASYTPDYEGHTNYGQVKANEITGGDYTAGGLELQNVALQYNSAGAGSMTLAADPITWDSIAATIRYALIYRKGSSDANSKLIGLIDFGQDRVYDSEPFQLSFPAGVVQLLGV